MQDGHAIAAAAAATATTAGQGAMSKNNESRPFLLLPTARGSTGPTQTERPRPTTAGITRNDGEERADDALTAKGRVAPGL